MTITSVLECPYCYEIFEVESPDKSHTTYSLARPVAKALRTNAVKKKHRCQNPKCKKIVTTYWYAPLSCLYQT